MLLRRSQIYCQAVKVHWLPVDTDNLNIPIVVNIKKNNCLSLKNWSSSSSSTTTYRCTCHRAASTFKLLKFACSHLLSCVVWLSFYKCPLLRNFACRCGTTSSGRNSSWTSVAFVADRSPFLKYPSSRSFTLLLLWTSSGRNSS